jgi:hypothetical protein
MGRKIGSSMCAGLFFGTGALLSFYFLKHKFIGNAA